MSGRLTDAILAPGTAYAAGSNAPMLDLQYGGFTGGFAPDFTEWVSHQNYIRKNIICLLLEAPKAFSLLPNGASAIATLRALFELHPTAIEGLNAGLEVEYVDTPAGGAGQVHHDWVDVKKAQTNVVMRYSGDKYGNAIQKFLYWWITNCIADPYSKYPNIATLSNKPTDHLADMYACSAIFIEPDPLHRKVMKSWLVTNMAPKGTGDMVGRRDITQAGELTPVEVSYTGIDQFGPGVDQFAQKLLDAINITGANPQMRPAFIQSITADVLAAQKGYQAGAQNLGTTAVRL